MADILSIAGQPLEDLGAVTNNAYQRVLNSFNAMNHWLNERQELAQQCRGAVWNSDGDEYFEELTACLDRLIKLYPKHIGNNLYGFISSTFLFWGLKFDVYHRYQEGHCPQHDTLMRYRQIFSLPNSWYRQNFSEGDIEWQTPECIPATLNVPFDFKDVDGYVDKFISYVKAAIPSATQAELYEAFSRLIIAWTKVAVQSCNGLLEVLIDDIYQDLKQRSNYHPNMLLKAITYFRQNGLRSDNGFDIVLMTLGNISIISPGSFAFAVENPDFENLDSWPEHIPMFRESIKISDIEKLAKEVAQQFQQSGLPSDYKEKTAWKLDITLPYSMPCDTMEQQWIDSFYLCEDGKIIIHNATRTLPMDFGDWAYVDFLGLVENLQWAESFKWERDCGGGEWAYPVAESFISASEAARKIVDALNSLKADIAVRKEAEDRRKAEDAKRKADEQRRQQEIQRKQQEEQRKKEAQSQQWAAQGLCRYCGGKIGVFGRKCKSCGMQN